MQAKRKLTHASRFPTVSATKRFAAQALPSKLAHYILSSLCRWRQHRASIPLYLASPSQYSLPACAFSPSIRITGACRRATKLSLCISSPTFIPRYESQATARSKADESLHLPTAQLLPVFPYPIIRVLCHVHRSGTCALTRAKISKS
ncbi:hypothetical protein MPH_04542 [Macrophomina phaseolina MS6]|uniref:Uncharacterized protein n=1 Tax=Macrophomina phaseolina (strain MS6) TaxID=1126212 RepID=K2RTQ5_MACPH|nr:hypothetical protein MPH_04542 [Macrophomina phaseolina MS6]